MVPTKKGFSLVLSLTIMSLLVLVVLCVAGFLNLESRIATVRIDMTKAQFNAVASGRMALGQLQVLAGADQRVTAKADLFEGGTYDAAALPYGTGPTNNTYLSLPAVPLTTPVTPMVPYYKRNWTGVWCTGGADVSKARDWDPRTPDEKVFLGWLISPLVVKSNDATLVDETKLPFVLPDRTFAATADKGRLLINGTGPASLTVTSAPAGRLVPLLDVGSLKYTGRPIYVASVAGGTPSSDPDKVELPVMPLPGAITGTISGGYAWWVGDEGVKAKINLADPYALPASGVEFANTTAWDMLFRSQSGRNAVELMGTGVVTARPFSGLTSWWDADLVSANNTSTPLLARTVTRTMLRNWASLRGSGSAADTAMGDALARHYHDVTPASYGVFSDTLNGGLRRDLSIAFELPFTDYAALTEFNDSPGDTGDINGKGASWSSGFNLASTMGINATNTPSFKEWGDASRKLGFLYELPMPTALWSGRSVSQSNPTSNGCLPIIRGPTWDLLRNYYRLYKRELEQVSTAQRRGQPAPSSDAWVARGSEPFTYAIGDSSSVTTSYQGQNGFWAYRANSALISRKNAAGNYGSAEPIQFPVYSNHPYYGGGVGPIPLHTSMKLAPNVARVGLIFTTVWTNTTLGVSMEPRITLHNPYNVPLEFTGMGLSLGKFYKLNFAFYRADTGAYVSGIDLQPMYFYGRALTFRIFNNGGTLANPNTANGDPINVGKNGTIRLEPGELRTYCASPTTTDQIGEVVYNGGTANGEIKKIPGFFGWGTTGQSLVYRVATYPDTSTWAGTKSIRVKAGFGYNANDGSEGGYCYETGQMDFHLFFNQLDNGTGVNAGLRSWLGYTNSPELDNADEHLVHRIQFLPRGLPTAQRVVSSPTDIPINSPSNTPFVMMDLRVRGWDDAGLANQRSDTPSPLFTNQRAQLLDYRNADGDANAPAGWALEFYGVNTLVTNYEISTGRNNSFGGKSSTSAGGGQTNVILYQVPTRPLTSLAGLASVDYTHVDTQPGLTIGNSYCLPGLDSPTKLISWVNNSGAVSPAAESTARLIRYDATWPSNHALFDRYFFSGAFANEASSYGVTTKVDSTQSDSLTTAFNTLLAGGNPLANKRILWLIHNSITPTDLAQKLADFKNPAKTAKGMLHDGTFNINSTSKEAWKAVLGGLRGQKLPGATKVATSLTPLSRFDKVIANYDATNTASRFRALTDTEIDTLAEQIVIQVRLRGPFMSLSDFVNRRLVADVAANKDMGLKGPLQAAIDASGINNTAPYNATFTANTTRHPLGKALSTNSTEGTAQSALGAPGLLLQSDILNALGSSLSARSDTFIIRAYGESTDSAGRPSTAAWLELTVQRMPEMVVPDDNEPNTSPTSYRGLTANTDTTSSIFMDKFTPNPSIKKPNRFLGRRFKVIASRWLTPNEV